MKGELNLLYAHSDKIGYGRMGTGLHKALAAAGMSVVENLRPPPEVVLLPNELHNEGPGHPAGVACWLSYPSHARGWYEGQHAAIFTMWEATELPEAFRETLHAFDTCLVPSEQNRELFSNFHPNVKVVHLGIDPDAWHYTSRRPPGQFFDILVAGSGARKGTDIAYEAFLAAFPDGSWGDGPEPRLIMKAPKIQDFLHDRLVQFNGYLSAEDEIELYSSVHAMIAPSRGEGFGLQPLQGLAQGIPTILTDAHGHGSFAKLGFAVPAELAKAKYFMLGEAGEWWEPDFDACVDHLRYVYDHWDSACEDMVTSAQLVARDFTWERSAKAFVDAIGPEHFEPPYAGSGRWFVPEARRYLVVTTKAYTADVAGVTYHWAKGQQYYETADVKRILAEGGVLDPSCLDPTEPGWDPASVESYSARHSHCPTCNQRLGSQPTRADELEAAR